MQSGLIKNYIPFSIVMACIICFYTLTPFSLRKCILSWAEKKITFFFSTVMACIICFYTLKTFFLRECNLRLAEENTLSFPLLWLATIVFTPLHPCY